MVSHILIIKLIVINKLDEPVGVSKPEAEGSSSSAAGGCIASSAASSSTSSSNSPHRFFSIGCEISGGGSGAVVPKTSPYRGLPNYTF
jgi:hypothetical protein